MTTDQTIVKSQKNRGMPQQHSPFHHLYNSLLSMKKYGETFYLDYPYLTGLMFVSSSFSYFQRNFNVVQTPLEKLCISTDGKYRHETSRVST